MSKGWIILRDEGVLTLARRLPVRFDLMAQAMFPDISAGRLAQQIRQDMWRRLARLRGFAPVVRVERRDAGLLVTAGGVVAARHFDRAGAEAGIAALLADPVHRARWIAHAARRAGGTPR